MMQVLLMKIRTIHYVLVYMTNKNPTPHFTPTWFSDAFIALFGYPCFILTQYGIFFSTYLFVQATLTLIIKLNNTISIKYNLKQKKIFSSAAHGCFIILTAEMVNDLNHTHRKKHTLALPTFISSDIFSDTLNPFSDNQTLSINNTTGITSPPPFYTKRPNKIHWTRLELFPKRSPLSQHTIIYRSSMLPSTQEPNPLFLCHLSKTAIVLLSQLIWNTCLPTLTFLNYSSRLISKLKFTIHLNLR